MDVFPGTYSLCLASSKRGFVNFCVTVFISLVRVMNHLLNFSFFNLTFPLLSFCSATLGLSSTEVCKRAGIHMDTVFEDFSSQKQCTGLSLFKKYTFGVPVVAQKVKNLT